MELLYPEGPASVPDQLTAPSQEYKRHTWIAASSLLAFFLVYTFLSGWFGWTAYRIFNEGMQGGQNAGGNFFVGICATFLAIFLIKGLFFIRRYGTSGQEITAGQHPALFEFLNRLADESGAPRPHRVFLTPRVNAAVFYDLSIINFLFPSKKNLEIGLALVNVLTLSEFKAVLAHEFGHFGQGTMAIGNWVYISQQIAEQIISKRDKLDDFLEGMSRIDFRIAWVAWVVSLVVWSIRSLMDSLFRLVILAQRALSRQMEFQADLVSVSLTGSNELISALHKIQAADDAWNRAVNVANSEIDSGRRPHDLFSLQNRIIQIVAYITGDKAYGNTPEVPEDNPAAFRVFKSGFAHPPSMWSTHPSNDDREQNAKRTYLAAPHDQRSAWSLFTNPEQLRADVTSQFREDAETTPMTEEESIAQLDERYALLKYQPWFRGTYLGRQITRYVADPRKLYEVNINTDDLETSMRNLYTDQLADDLSALRSIREELGALTALLRKVYQPNGDRILFRGREISRRDLPTVIEEVKKEEDELTAKILAHDCRCRRLHLIAAEKVGHGWKDYLIGLIHLLHYAEHTLADLTDAQEALRNVFAVVTADGKISGSEQAQLVKAAEELHAVFLRINKEKREVIPDSLMLQRLGIESWERALEDYTMPQPDPLNLADWLGSSDAWASHFANPLSILSGATLEQLLETETAVAKLAISGESDVSDAPVQSKTPDKYPAFLPENIRERQRLSLWDRFQLADGLFPEIARLGVAGTIVVFALGFGTITASTSTLTIYNGLSSEVRVDTNGIESNVPPFAAIEIELQLNEKSQIATYAKNGRMIEHFKPELSGNSQHYVYNVAEASPLIEWSAAYGNATPSNPQFIGLTRWMKSDADFFFREPPPSVSTKGGGATRKVLSGQGNKDPDDVLKLLENEVDRERLVKTHAAWDDPKQIHSDRWKELASKY